jgi:hypothetical protein
MRSSSLKRTIAAIRPDEWAKPGGSTMSKAARTIAGSLMMGLVLAVAGSAGAETAKYAGNVRTIDSTSGSLVLEDVGPWVAKGPETPITPRTVIVSASTEYFVADRSKDGATGFPGDYKETRAQPSDVTVGAFIVVECQQAPGRCVAAKLTVVRPSLP